MKMDHIVIYASDLDESRQFYQHVLSALGFALSREWVWLNSDGFAVDLRQATSSTRYDRFGPGLNHIGYSVTKDEFNELISRLTESGITLPPVQELDGAMCLFLPDPDGLRIEIAYELDP